MRPLTVRLFNIGLSLIQLIGRNINIYKLKLGGEKGLTVHRIKVDARIKYVRCYCTKVKRIGPIVFSYEHNLKVYFKKKNLQVSRCIVKNLENVFNSTAKPDDASHVIII